MNKLMNFDEAKAYLNTSRATLYRLIHDKKIPAFKMGGQWRFKKEFIDQWIEKHENVNLHLRDKAAINEPVRQ